MVLRPGDDGLPLSTIRTYAGPSITGLVVFEEVGGGLRVTSSINAPVTTPEAGPSTLLMHTQCQHCCQQFHTIRALQTHIEEVKCQRETGIDEEPDVTFLSPSPKEL